ncbi:MAG TPA: BPSS1780 family membrane protein, partial [Lamprocystis sp. (in: g-proteobacteria)]|nr:BPSS1780 family membrane protein [Lamprocystis sp. (in: g-proteobacteria)]
PGGQRCPKCRAPSAVSPLTGVCQACGVVVERYLARQAAQANGSVDPYAPPSADLTPPGPGAAGQMLRTPRRVSAGQAWRWIAAGFAAFRAAPLPWVLATLLFGMLNGLTRAAEALAGSVGSPVVAISGAVIGVLSFLLGPMIVGGIIVGLEKQRRGGQFRIQHLLAGFAVSPGRLAMLGVAYLLLIIGTMVMVGIILGFGGAFDALMSNGANPADLAAVGQGILGRPLTWVGIGFGVVALFAIWMMSSFAPALVVLDSRSPLQALAQSLLGCVRNIPAGLVYWVSLILLGAAVTLGLILLISVGAVIAQLGVPVAMIALAAFVIGLFTLSAVSLAVLVGSVYAAYRDIYFR